MNWLFNKFICIKAFLKTGFLVVKKKKYWRSNSDQFSIKTHSNENFKHVLVGFFSGWRTFIINIKLKIAF